MIEILKHALGLCGDNHPNILAFIAGGFGFPTFFSYIISKFKSYGKNIS